MKIVLLIIKNEKDEILFLLRKKKPFGWSLPGGKVNDGETLEQAIIREIMEETGISVSTSILFSHIGMSITGDEVGIYTTTLDETPIVKISKNEHLSSRWLKNYDGLVLAGNTRLFLDK